MRRATVGLMIVAAAAALMPGCVGRLAKEGVGLGRGAKGAYFATQPVAPTRDARPLGVYGRFELAPPVDDFGGRTPAEFSALLSSEFQRQLAEKHLPDRPGSNTLLIRTTILHFELAGAMGNVFGPFEEVVARVELVDKDSGRVLGKANCIGRSSESVNKGVAKKAEGLAGAILDWIASRYPETK
jgi:hypothetical protein